MAIINVAQYWLKNLKLSCFNSIRDAVEVKKFDDDIKEIGPISAKIQLKEIGLQEFRKIEGDIPNRKDLESRFTDNLLIVALDGNKFAGFIWGTCQPRSQEGEQPFLYPITPNAGYIYLYDLFIAPQWRNQALGKHMIHKSLEVSKANNLKGAFYTHDTKNKYIDKISNQLGFTKVGEITFKRTFGFTSIDLEGLKQVAQWH